MSLSDAMYIGTSGLDAMSTALGVVGNDVSNASTIGYKSDVTQFSDLLGGQLDGQSLGGGVQVSGVEQLFTQGSLQQTGNPLDVAIQGNGFFVVNGSPSGGPAQNYYTRDGQFELNNAGDVVDSQGMQLQGYTVNAAGVQSSTLSGLQLGNLTSPAEATANAGMQLNLNSATTTVGPFNPANPAATSDYETSVTAYDSLGASHQVNVYFDKDATGQWSWHAMTDGGALVGGTAGTQTQIASGTMTFGTNGQLATQTTTSSSASFVGATANQNIAFNFTGTTQDANPSAVSSVDVDGQTSGTLTGITIGTNGQVTGNFTNGQSTTVAQLALATFNNNNGLADQGNQTWAATSASGQPAIAAAGQGGRGSVEQGALEQSNVDMSAELVTMIQYQRAFEANSKTVTTAGEMLQTVTQMTT